MSRPIVPRPTMADSGMTSPQSAAAVVATTAASGTAQKPRKISTACGACKQRKTRCTGNSPCDACATRGTPCVYDVTSDQRRKIANQRNVQELLEAQNNLERYRQLLGGIIATLRAGDLEESEDMVVMIRSGMDLSQLAAHVRNARRANPAIDQAFSQIDFMIDSGPEELPSTNQLLTSIRSGPGSRGSISSVSGGDMANMNSFLDPAVNHEMHEDEE